MTGVLLLLDQVAGAGSGRPARVVRRGAGGDPAEHRGRAPASHRSCGRSCSSTSGSSSALKSLATQVHRAGRARARVGVRARAAAARARRRARGLSRGPGEPHQRRAARRRTSRLAVAAAGPRQRRPPCGRRRAAARTARTTGAGLRGMRERAVMVEGRARDQAGANRRSRGAPRGAGGAARSLMPIPLVTQILVADDHEIVRRGLKLVMDSEPDLDVVAEAADGARGGRARAFRRRRPRDPRREHAAHDRPPGRA